MTATAPKDVGTPAALERSQSETTVPIPAKSEIVVLPEHRVQVTVPEPTTMTVKSVSEHASTGTIDTEVAKHRIDSQAKQPFLFASIASIGAVVFFMWRGYPTGAMLAGLAGVIFFLFWKLSDLPSWFWVVGLATVVGATFLFLGYERAEKDKSAGA
jgi:hypothetical protein